MVQRIMILIAALMGIYAQGQEYKKINRTYINLTNIDFSECLFTFQIIHGNYMNCSRRMMNFVSDKMDNITSTRYPRKSFTFPITGKDSEFFISIETAGPTASDHEIWASGYYQKTGQAGPILQLSNEFYTSEIFMSYLNQALLKISQNGGWKSEWPLLAIPKSFDNSTVKDEVLGAIYVARRKIDLNIEDCKKTFDSEEVDNWPDNDYWISSCAVNIQPDQSPIPLDASRWSSELQMAIPKEISMGAASLTFSVGGYSIKFEGHKLWSEVKDDVKAVMEKTQFTVYPYFIVEDSKFETLTEKDKILGKLILRDDLLGIDGQYAFILKNLNLLSVNYQTTTFSSIYFIAIMKLVRNRK
jgi:hypothetical protein